MMVLMRAEYSASAPAKNGASASDAIQARERGLSLVSRANRWMIGLALLLAGALTGLTAHAFHAKPASAQTARSVASSQTRDDGSGGSTSAPPLQAPTSAPIPAAPAPVAPVVSGGS
jgi:hypothetical protein